MILLVGLNHRTAPVEIREQLAFSRDEWTAFLTGAKADEFEFDQIPGQS